MDYYGMYSGESLFHYGVVGMKWGVRRYQPYSYTRNRDYGKSGKELGLARKLGKSHSSGSGDGRESRSTVNRSWNGSHGHGLDVGFSWKEERKRYQEEKAKKQAEKAKKQAESDKKSGGLSSYLKERREAKQKEKEKQEAERKKQEADAKRKESLEKARLAKEQKIAQEKAQKEAMEKDRQEREKILKEGTADDLYANRHRFNEQEINQAMNRIKMERRIKDLQASEKMAKFDEIQNVVNKVVSYGTTAAALIDTGSKLFDKGKELKSKIDEARGITKEKTAKEKLLESNDWAEKAKNIGMLTKEEAAAEEAKAKSWQQMMNAAERQNGVHNKDRNNNDNNSGQNNNGEQKNNNEGGGKKNKGNNGGNNENANNTNNGGGNNQSKDVRDSLETVLNNMSNYSTAQLNAAIERNNAEQKVRDAFGKLQRKNDEAAYVRAVSASKAEYSDNNDSGSNKQSKIDTTSSYIDYMKEALVKEENRKSAYKDRVDRAVGVSPAKDNSDLANPSRISEVLQNGRIASSKQKVMDRINLGRERKAAQQEEGRQYKEDMSSKQDAEARTEYRDAYGVKKAWFTSKKPSSEAQAKIKEDKKSKDTSTKEREWTRAERESNYSSLLSKIGKEKVTKRSDIIPETKTTRTKFTNGQIALARSLAKREDMTLKDVAKQMGISTSTISKWMNGGV